MSAAHFEAFDEGAGISVVEVDAQQGWALLEQAANEMLGMGVDEFLKRWDHDEFTDDQRPAVTWVSAFIPLAHA